jgi:hypothetical protein
VATLDNQEHPEPSSVDSRLDRLAEITADEGDRQKLLDYLDGMEQDEADSEFFTEAIRIPELRLELECYCDHIGQRITATTTAEILRHAHYIANAEYLAPESKLAIAKLTKKINADVLKLTKQLLRMLEHDITTGRPQAAAELRLFAALLEVEQGESR